MDTIIIHPKTKTSLLKYLAKRLDIPYEISKGKPVRLSGKFAGKLSSKTAKKLQEHIAQSRNEWERNI